MEQIDLQILKVEYLPGKTIDIECKSCKKAHPVYNGGLPKPGVIYIFCSERYNKTTIFNYN